MTAGALGGKLIGAGGGGFFLFSCRPEKRENVIAAVTKDTQCKVYPFKFSDSGSRIVTAMCV
jgi:D-glycero-alpha-D-manno-heptose-7-phosphate kinase